MLDSGMTRTCGANGMWSGSEPTCPRKFKCVMHSCFDMIPYTLAVDCGPLTNPTNGMVDASTTTFMSTATYTCVSGYVLDSGMTRTCGATGEWSGSEPTCPRKFRCVMHSLVLI